ncbi:GGDEF domain-containing protein [Actinoplanes sp. CA-015351]|uniref:GGDEF domain-containing protein n=1 Tax=Actinoplanes sp. CA-015351 TaxID=3239897 RepID=UPI003D988658
MSGGTAAHHDLTHRHALERVALWTRVCVMVMVGAVVLGAPGDVRWTTAWQPALWQVSTVIALQLAVAMALAVFRLRHAESGRYRWVAAAQTVLDVLAVASPMLVVESVAGVPVWPTAVLALLSAATRHTLTGVLISWVVVSAALVAGVVLGDGGPDSPHGAGVVLAVVVLLVTAATAGVQANSLDRYVTELHGARLAMTRQARTDPLTGLANRAALQEYESAAEPGQLTVVLLDLDGFKQVNDVYGHHAGDLLLITVADRLRARMRADDLLLRLGGDEFAVVLPGAAAEDAATAAETWARAVAEPVDVGGGVARVGVSVGVACRPPGDDATLADLLRVADRRMYEHKHDKRRTAA